MKQFWLSLAVVCFGPQVTFGEVPNKPIGLPGTDTSLPLFAIDTQLPPLTDEVPDLGGVFLLPNVSIHQNFVNGDELVNPKGPGAPQYVWLLQSDFESITLQVPVVVGLGDGVAVGASLKLQYYGGGFLDRFVGAWHSLFGFPNNNRELYPENQIQIGINTVDGQTLSATAPFWYWHDPLIFAGLRLLNTSNLGLAGFFYLNLPFDHQSFFGGQRPLQTSISINGSFQPIDWFWSYGSIGVVVPWSLNSNGPRPQIMLTARLAATFSLGDSIGLFLGFNFQTSPNPGYMFRENNFNFFTSPLCDLHFGVSFRDPASPSNATTVTVQEDPFWHNSDDISLYLSGAYRF